MNTRICSVIASVTLLILSSGCGGTRNFLFGRGARCGACGPSASTAPAYTTAPTYGQPQPLVSIPNAPAFPAAPYQPRCRLFGGQPRPQQPVACEPYAGCECQNPCGNVYTEGCGTCSSGCGTCNSYPGGCGECAVASPCGGCGGGCGGGPVVTDPYMSGEIGGGSMPYNGQIISDQVIGEQVIGGQVIGGQVIGGQVIGGQVIGGQVIGGQGYPSSTAPIQADDFRARKFDSDGNRILWEEPLPQGTTSL